MLYKFALYTHILSAIIAIGPFFVLIPVLNRMRTAEEKMLTMYLDIFQVTIRIIKHAGHVLVISGVLLIMLASWPWTTSWLVVTMVAMLISLVYLVRAFKPVIVKFRAGGINQAQLSGQLMRAVWIYIGLLLVILLLMVVKPTFW